MAFTRPKHDYEIFRPWCAEEPRYFRRGSFLAKKNIRDLKERRAYMEGLVGCKLVYLGSDGGFLYGSEDGTTFLVHHPSHETIWLRSGESLPSGHPYHDSFFEVEEYEGGHIRRVIQGSDNGRESASEGEEEETGESTFTLQPETRFEDPLLG